MNANLPQPDMYPGWKEWAAALLMVLSEPENVDTVPGLLNDIILAGGPVGGTLEIPVIEWNAQGRLTSVSTVAIPAIPTSTTGLAEGTNLYFTAERVDDRVAGLIQNGTGITWNYNDALNTLTPTVTVTQYTDEMVDDRVALLIQNGTGITWLYNDGAGTLTPTVTVSQYTDEMAQDAVGGILVDSGTIGFTYDDAAGAITGVVKNDSITYALMQNVSATNKLLGRTAAGAGDPGEIDIGAWGTLTTAPTSQNSAASFAGTANVRWKQLGKFVFINATITITNMGTGGTGFRWTLPVAPLNVAVLFGQGASSGIVTVAKFNAGATTSTNYRGSTGALEAQAQTYEFTGVYEAA